MNDKQERCPRCGDPLDGFTFYRCGSRRFSDGGFWYQSDRCRIRQLERDLAEREAAARWLMDRAEDYEVLQDHRREAVKRWPWLAESGDKQQQPKQGK